MPHVWLDRHDATVGEVAEALAVPTDYVFAALTRNGRTFAFYSPEVDVTPVEMKRATLYRDVDGILRRDIEDEIDVPNVEAVLVDPYMLYQYLE